MRTALVPVVLLLPLGLACSGLLGSGESASSDATAEAPADVPATKKVQGGGAFAFGTPAGWEREKEAYDEDGEKGVIYTLTGPDASVVLAVQPKDSTPTPLGEIEAFRGGLNEALGDAVTWMDAVPTPRTLAGQQVEGMTQPFTIATPQGTAAAEHRVWVVHGATTSVLVVADIPDTSVAGVDAQIDEVLTPLEVP